MAYDPVKAHEYYERTKKLKDRKKGAGSDGPKTSRSPKPATSRSVKPSSSSADSAKARVSRLKSKVSSLQGALSEAQAALSKKRQEAVKTEKKNSDGKSTAAEKRASKEYRDKNRQKIASEKKDSKSSGGGTSTSSSNSVSDMGVEELESRIIKIKSALSDAKRQLSNASQQLGQLAHSAITSEPTINDQFARFRSAERIPSNEDSHNGSGFQWLRHS